jgi:predicted peptidase
MICVICYLAVGVTQHVEAQQTHEQYIRPVNYLLYLPNGYLQDTLKKWPLLLFLHGSGERWSFILGLNQTSNLAASEIPFYFCIQL